MRAMVYDLEIERGILKGSEQPVEGIKYCDGWRDFDNMGITVAGACIIDHLAGEQEEYHIFLKDNFKKLQDHIDTCDFIVGFNNHGFDDNLLRANGFSIHQSADILGNVWEAAGLSRKFQYPSHMGYSLDALCEANGIGQKTGHGAQAPIDWQQGKYGKVIDYCLQDVRLTVQLYHKINHGAGIISPHSGKRLEVKDFYTTE